MTNQVVLVGDCRATLAKLPDNSVHCVVTSPPYLGLRDYGVDGQIGLEQSVSEHIAVMVDVFAEVWRVLRPDGTLWLNYGDAYASSVNGRSAEDTKVAGNDDRTFRDKPLDTVKASGLKPKDLMMLPARLALALQDWGWWLRSDIIWAKPNPMPESATDRPTTAHEHVFLFAKSERYFYDADAIRTAATAARMAQDVAAQEGSHRANGGTKSNGTMRAVGDVAKGANARNVWTIATDPFAAEFCTACRGYFEGRGKNRIRVEKIRDEAGKVVQEFRHCPCGRHDAWLSHFATFPRELARRCIAAGAPTRVCSTCCAPYERQSERTFEAQADVSPEKRRRAAGGMDKSRRDAGTERGSIKVRTIGFLPTCDCVDAAPAPAVVLDPFGGAGTVGVVAYEMGRDATLCEPNPDYADMARQRIERARAAGKTGSLEEWADVAQVPPTPPATVRVKPRGEQITLMELIADHDAEAAAKLDVAEVAAIVADVPAPEKPKRKRLKLNAAQRSPMPSLCGVGGREITDVTTPAPKRKAKEARALPPPAKPPRKTIRKAKPETPTARVKRERAAPARGRTP